MSTNAIAAPAATGFRPGDYLKPAAGGPLWIVDSYGHVWSPGLCAPADAIPVSLAQRLYRMALVPAGSWSEQVSAEAHELAHPDPVHACPGCPPGGVLRDMSAEVSWMEAAA